MGNLFDSKNVRYKLHFIFYFIKIKNKRLLGVIISQEKKKKLNKMKLLSYNFINKNN